MTTSTWRTNLQDSVLALRMAADEHRGALRLAQTGRWAVAIPRLQHNPGAVTIGGWSQMHPVDTAVATLRDIFDRLTLELHDRYEDAALAYAYGATWAASQVLDGHTPDAVALAVGDDGRPAPGARPNITAHLATYPGRAAYVAAHLTLAEHESARALGDELAARPYLAGHEASEMHDAYASSRDLADAAHTFGVEAERALRHVLRHRGETPGTDPGELIARHLEDNPPPDDAGPGLTTEQVARRLGLDRRDDQEATRAQD